MILEIGKSKKADKDYRNFINLRFKKTSFHWFIDCEDWFVYLRHKKKYLRFSSAGFMKGQRLETTKDGFLSCLLLDSKAI